MFYKTYLLKYGEIGVKGKNRNTFEDALVGRVREVLRNVDGKFHVYKEQGRVLVDVESEEGSVDFDELIAAIQTVFGIVGICPVLKTELGLPISFTPEVISFMQQTYGLSLKRSIEEVLKMAENGEGKPEGSENPGDCDLAAAEKTDLSASSEKKPLTFKVHSRRANKRYPIPSMDVNAFLGERILDAFGDQVQVDVHEPDVMLYVELRDEVYLYSKILPGPGGMPYGTNGRAELLLSGGIDSPVAGYMIARRGVRIDAVYFHAPPYTSERAREKVLDLAKRISRYTGPIRLHVVNFTDIQMMIYEKCPHDELTIIMRRYMMRIAEYFALKDGAQGLITGESLGQVASQTIQSIYCTDEAASIPVFRPLISFDKQDIVDLSMKIGTYETSIEPYQDCCTIFVAKHPVTKPRLDVIQRSEQKLEGFVEELLKSAEETAETIEIG